jgi:hypothetical protein
MESVRSLENEDAATGRTRASPEIAPKTRVDSDSLAFAAALTAVGPADDRAAAMMPYGQFIGSWDGTLVVHRQSGERFECSCEVHFGWALAGRAVQDVWIAPSRTGRAPNEVDLMYGTTLRVYDPKADHWEITFIDPARQKFDRMIGRSVGPDIVQDYEGPDGRQIQWCFTEITGDSFHWISRESTDHGGTWRLTAEFFFRRRVGHAAGEHALAGRAHRREFDFWLGAWTVSDPRTGALLGVSRVDRVLGGSVLHEHWSGADGYRGESLNVFDEDRKCWHQSWVSDNGTVLLLDGGTHEGAMDLQGSAPDGTHQRIRWWPQEDGTVRQRWESSRDGGRTWEQRFEGIYRRA